MFPRSSGILLHPSSLFGKYGIGTLGENAVKFIDFLDRSNQKLWQVFPLGPTGFGDSPYQSFSAFAGNPFLIDLEKLVLLDLLKIEDIEGAELEKDINYVDFGTLYKKKLPLLKKAYDNLKNIDNEKILFELEIFKEENSFWLEDYSLFISLKYHFKGHEWSKWDEGIKLRKEKDLKKYKELLKEEIELNNFIQYLFFHQWGEIKGYANSKGISIIGDIPIFVAFDSSDAWANSEIFLLRNKSKAGIGFFEDSGFYPDFILWILKDGKQYINFCDPKGIRNLNPKNDPKINFHKSLKEKEAKLADSSIVLNSFIISNTPFNVIQNLHSDITKIEMDTKNVLFQNENEYINNMFAKIL